MPSSWSWELASADGVEICHASCKRIISELLDDSFAQGRWILACSEFAIVLRRIGPAPRPNEAQGQPCNR